MNEKDAIEVEIPCSSQLKPQADVRQCVSTATDEINTMEAMTTTKPQQRRYICIHFRFKVVAERWVDTDQQYYCIHEEYVYKNTLSEVGGT